MKGVLSSPWRNLNHTRLGKRDINKLSKVALSDSMHMVLVVHV